MASSSLFSSCRPQSRPMAGARNPAVVQTCRRRTASDDQCRRRTAGRVPHLSPVAGRCDARGTSSPGSTGTCRSARLTPSTLSCLGHLDRAAKIAPAAERPLVELLARSRHALRWGQTYTAADFGQRFIDNYGWMELVRLARPFRQRQCGGGLPDPRPGYRLSRPPSRRRGTLRAADRRHRLAQRRGRLRAARRRRDHPPPVQRQPRDADRQPSRWLRSISGAAGRWRRNRRSSRPANSDHSAGSPAFGQ